MLAVGKSKRMHVQDFARTIRLLDQLLATVGYRVKLLAAPDQANFRKLAAEVNVTMIEVEKYHREHC